MLKEYFHRQTHIYVLTVIIRLGKADLNLQKLNSAALHATMNIYKKEETKNMKKIEIFPEGLTKKQFSALALTTELFQQFKWMWETPLSKFKFSQSILFDDELALQSQSDIKLFKVLENNLTLKFILDFCFRHYQGKNRIIKIDGETGMGKSQLAIFVAWFVTQFIKLYIFPEASFSISNITFNKTEMLEELKKVGKHAIFVSDEDKNIRIGEGSQREIEETELLEQSIRAESNSFLFLSPMPYGERGHVEHFLINVLAIDYSNKVSISIVEKQDRTGMYSRVGYILTTLCPDNKLQQDYKTKKDAFIKSIKQRQALSSRLKERDDLTKKIYFELGFNKLDDKSEPLTKLGAAGKKGISKTDISNLIGRKYPHLAMTEIEQMVSTMCLIQRGLLEL